MYVCDYWRPLTPQSISFSHGEGSKKVFITYDFALQGLIVVSCSKHLTHFDLLVEELCHGATRSSSGISVQVLSDDESCS
ncbi:hypothetical protein MKX01_030349 [Papaver californicum]|nr:hypothetical protein MKX01_030349 [Papaver californicum]